MSMVINLNSEDLKTLAELLDLAMMSEDFSDRAYNRALRLAKKINSQIPESKSGSRRIKTYD